MSNALKIDMAIKNKTIFPIFVEQINGSYIIAVYQGSLSKFDILIKYRQKEGEKWSRIRTPKHIHWAVDIMIKMHSEPDTTKRFLEFLIDIWESTTGIKSEEERSKLLNINNLLSELNQKTSEFYELSEKGEYSVKFLLLLAKLLMSQEKTNLDTAYMFGELLKALRAGNDIFKIVSIATHNGR